MNRLASTNRKRIFPLEKITSSLRISLKPDRELTHIKETALVLALLGHLMSSTWKLMNSAARNRASVLRAFEQCIDRSLGSSPFVPPGLTHSASMGVECVEKGASIAPPAFLLRLLLHTASLPALASIHAEELRYLVLHTHARANPHRMPTALHLETELCPSATSATSTRHHRLVIASSDISEDRATGQRVSEIVGAQNVVDARAEVVDPTLQFGVETSVRIALCGVKEAEAVDHSTAAISR